MVGKMKIANQILVLVLLTLINAFFAGAELAVVSVNKNKIKRLAEEGNKKAALIRKLSRDSTGFLSTIQVAITLAGFFSSASAATGISQVLAKQMNSWGMAYSTTVSVVVVTIILSYFTLVFGELVPKRVALQNAERFSLFAVRPIYLISKALNPFIRLLSVSTNGFLQLIGMRNEHQEAEVSEEEIRALLQTGRETGVFNDIEEEMITSVFLFDDKRVKEVMTQRQDITYIDLEEPPESYIDEAIRSRHSRIPVCIGEIDQIVGILSIKDYLIYVGDHPDEEIDIRKIMKEPVFVPESNKIDKLFKVMQENQQRMVVVIDEYGGVAGILTIMDLVEEIVGDIYDEHEITEAELTSVGPNSYRVSGQMLIADLNEELNLKITSESDTLSGHLIEQLGYIPQEKHLPLSIKSGLVHYTVLEINNRVISWAEMEIISE